MTNSFSTSFQIPEQYYKALFEALSGNNVLLLPDPPHFTILAVSPSYIIETGSSKESMVGKGIFEAFPGSDDPDNTGTKDLLDSLNSVLANKTTHHLPIQRYDTTGEDGSFIERYWKASNKPVFSPDGEVAYIIHSAEEITKQVTAEKREIQLEGIEKAFSLFMHAPMVVGLVNGDGYVLEMANEEAFKLWGKGPEIVGKPILQALPELKEQGIIELFDQVRSSGKPYIANEVPVSAFESGTPGDQYFNLVYQPYYADDREEATGVFTISHNVSEQVRARQKAIENEEKYRNLVDSMNQAYCTLEVIFEGDRCVNYRYLETNPSFDRHIGMSNALGKTILDIAPDIEPKWFDFYGGVVLTGVPIRIEEESKALKKWFEVYAIRLGASEDRKVGVFFTDITERKKTEAAVHESEITFRTMAESTPVLITVGDENGDIKYFNKAWTDLTNLTATDLQQMGWVDIIYKEDRERFSSIFLNALAIKAPFRGEFRVLNAAGEPRWLLADGVPRFAADGKFMGYISACTDITERKLSHQQLQTALEQARLSKEAAELGTFDMDLETGDMHWDQRCRTLFGISHIKPVSFDLDFIKRLHPDDQERVLVVVKRAFDKGASNGDYDVEYRTIGAEDGIVRWVRAKGKVYFDAQAKPVRFIGSVLDITEQVVSLQNIERLVEDRTRQLAQANENLLHANKELQRSNANLEEFTYAASHDLKEPIRKISIFTNQLKGQLADRLGENESRIFSRVQNATERMGNLIDDLLLYSHVTQRPHETESLDLNQKVQSVLEDLELDIAEKNAVIEVAMLPTVQGYRRQLMQLFQNLISNAIKYTKPNAPPHVFINASKVTEQGKRYHAIKIKDNGIGFEEEYADRIFQMFTRLHGKNEYNGTGVGLSIVKKVVENHNGMIRVESKPGEGSTFTILLPASETH